MLISQSITGLYNGVSQQASAVRHENQCEELTNAYPTVVRGVSKRPPTEHVVKALSLANIADANAYVHFIHRDSVEQYAVIFKSDQTITVVDLLTGAIKTTQYDVGTAAYLPTNPKRDLAVITVADYTFIVNKTKVVSKGTTAASGTLGVAYPSLLDINDIDTGISPPSGEHEITGDMQTTLDSFYVQGDGETWREIPRPGQVVDWDATTMPHALVRSDVDTFTLQKLTWEDRKSGDDNINPFVSFEGGTIEDVFFHRNRLGFTSGENVVMSEAGEFFNFHRTTCVQLLDSDPIDVSAAHNKISLLKHALPFNKSLFLFSPQAQFVLEGSDLLTPKTVGIDQTTEYETNTTVKPVGSGSTIFFATPGGSFSNVREYYPEEESQSNVAANVTAHVPKYIPAGVRLMTASSNYDVLFLVTDEEPNVLYVYKYYWKGLEKLQSAWSRWVFPSDVDIRGISCIENQLYMVINRAASGTYVEKLNMEPFTFTDTMGFQVHLDRLDVVTGTYNAGNDETTFSLNYEIDLANDVELVLSDDFTNEVGQLLDPDTYTRPNEYTIVVPGDYSGGNVYVGEPFEFALTFSRQFPRDSKGTILDGDLRLRTMTVFYEDTAFFTAKVQPLGRAVQETTQTHTIETQYTGKTVGSPALILGQPAFGTGHLRFPVFSDAKTVTISLTNSSHLGCSFTKAEWEGNYTRRNRRAG